MSSKQAISSRVLHCLKQMHLRVRPDPIRTTYTTVLYSLSYSIRVFGCVAHERMPGAPAQSAASADFVWPAGSWDAALARLSLSRVRPFWSLEWNEQLSVLMLCTLTLRLIIARNLFDPAFRVLFSDPSNKSQSTNSFEWVSECVCECEWVWKLSSTELIMQGTFNKEI